MKSFAYILLLIGGVASVQAQTSPRFMDFSRPTLDWYQIETEHFMVLFHADEYGQGASRTAQVTARVAEDVYGPITELYGHEPDSKVYIILKDYEDYSNGAAFFFDNKIEIWAPALNSPLRGAHDWLRNVITHEFTHIVQVQAAMKLPRTVPFGYLQILDYENARRPDVLYGYPNVLISYPVVGLVNPAWLAEGTAQYQHSDLHYDQWDSHRDMLLRTQVLQGKTLELHELGSFYSKNSLMREGVYNHGYAFTLYLAQKYGVDVLSEITDGLRDWDIWRVEHAISSAIGADANEEFNLWHSELENFYRQATAPIQASIVEGDILASEGFANYYPRLSPDGSKLAYISNKGGHNSRVSLYVRDMTGDMMMAHDLGMTAIDHICSLGHRIRAGVTGGAAWRPDGNALAYARAQTTSEGFLYTDLYLTELNTQATTQLTRHARASQPAWDSTGSRIVYVTSSDGTANLKVLDVQTGESRPVTEFSDGTQVSDPAWYGEWIYFARLDPGRHGNDLWRIQADGSLSSPVVQTPADERSPMMADSVLYYASDATGIYNLYRMAGGVSEQLTQVIGGAFMPDKGPDGQIVYATYRWDGYKIATLNPVKPLKAGIPYQPPDFIAKSDISVITGSDEDIAEATAEELSDAIAGNTLFGVDSLHIVPYGSGFTSFLISPVLRLDQYTGRRLQGRVRSRTETLWRNLKFGAYLSSREVLEGMRLFGGFLISPGSHGDGSILAPANLLALERDAFLEFDYTRGFRWLPYRWSPQISIQLFNIQRMVENGLSIEEHPCTACLPGVTHTDLMYGLWEGNLYLRSKINRFTVLELGYRYSPYRVTTHRFYSRELMEWIPSTSSRYYIGRSYMLNAYFEIYRAHRESDIMRTGIQMKASYNRESGRLLEQFDVQEGQLVPVYGASILHRLRVDLQGGIRLPNQIRGTSHGLHFRARLSTIFGKRTDSFYYDYVGGMSGARGYPFYGLGGTETLWLQTSWTVPLFPDIKRQIGPVYADKLFMRVYMDAARVGPQSRALRKDVGGELRLMMGSYYLLPTALFVSATYGMDSFEIQLDDRFISTQPTVRYGKQVQWHFGMLFGFDL